MFMRFQDWENEIQSYCLANHLDFERAKMMPKCCGKEDIILPYHDPAKGKAGLLDDTPAPPALWIRKKRDGTLDFEQTEYTQRCLGMNP